MCIIWATHGPQASVAARHEGASLAGIFLSYVRARILTDAVTVLPGGGTTTAVQTPPEGTCSTTGEAL